ncbi:MAG TPA: frataxin domain-containing protein [Bryobacteraceae bacterium]|nr:frataxin domain-containing protein [Bryobacteraceae bacterium]
MIEEHDFKKHTEEALRTIQSDLVLAGDDYGFQSSLHGGSITISFPRPPAKFTIVPDAAAQQLKVAAGARTYKLDWDIVENAFVQTETQQTLKELLEQAISKHLKQDVQL